jgi:hypothetical protein
LSGSLRAIRSIPSTAAYSAVSSRSTSDEFTVFGADGVLFGRAGDPRRTDLRLAVTVHPTRSNPEHVYVRERTDDVLFRR